MRVLNYIRGRMLKINLRMYTINQFILNYASDSSRVIEGRSLFKVLLLSSYIIEKKT